MSGTNSIVIIEDEADLRNALQMKLEEAGYEVRPFASSEDALVSLSGNVPSLVILDLFTHSIHGVPFLKRLRSNPATKHIPCLVLTNIDHPDHREKASELGVVAYCIKSNTSLDEIVATVNAHVR